MTILLWFLSPIGRWVGIGLLALSLVGGIYGKGRYDDHVAYTAKLDARNTKLNTKADAARTRATDQFDAGRVPDDGYARD